MSAAAQSPNQASAAGARMGGVAMTTTIITTTIPLRGGSG